MYPLGLKGKGKSKLDKGKGKGKGTLCTKGKMTGGKRTKPKCWNCGNYGHLSKDCKVVNAVTEGDTDEDYGENERLDWRRRLDGLDWSRY